MRKALLCCAAPLCAAAAFGAENNDENAAREGLWNNLHVRLLALEQLEPEQRGGRGEQHPQQHLHIQLQAGGGQGDEGNQHGTDAEPDDEERGQDQFEQNQADAEHLPDPPLHFHMSDAFRGGG